MPGFIRISRYSPRTTGVVTCDMGLKERVAIPIPTFGRWTDQPMETGKRVDMYPLLESTEFELNIDSYIKFIRARKSRVAVLCNPNNPDGGYLPRREIIRFMDE